MVNPKIARARLREKAIREGDGFGHSVSATEFDEAYEIYVGKVIRDYPGDSEDERDLRAVRSVGIYLWRKKTLEQLLPDLFSEGLSSIAEETPASTSAEAARLEAARLEARFEAAKLEATRFEAARLEAAAAEAARIAAARLEAPITATPAQHPPATQSTIMIAGIPLHDWVFLKQADPETAKILMEIWQAQEAAKEKDLELEQRLTDKEKNKSNWGPDGSYSQAVEPDAKAETNDNEKKNTSNSTVTSIHIGRVWMAPAAVKVSGSSAAPSSSNDTKESVQNTTKEGKVFENNNEEYKEHRFKKYRSQKQASRFKH